MTNPYGLTFDDPDEIRDYTEQFDKEAKITTNPHAEQQSQIDYLESAGAWQDDARDVAQDDADYWNDLYADDPEDDLEDE